MAMLPENGVQGLMTGILGSAAALAIAFPLALGGSVYDPAAATGAARTGMYATNGAGSESIAYVVGGKTGPIHLSNGSGVQTQFNGGTQAGTSFPAVTIVQTFNNAANTYTALDINVTNTASAAGSYLTNWRVAGTAVANLDVSGNFLGNTFQALTASGTTAFLHSQSFAGKMQSTFQNTSNGSTSLYAVQIRSDTCLGVLEAFSSTTGGGLSGNFYVGNSLSTGTLVLGTNGHLALTINANSAGAALTPTAQTSGTPVSWLVTGPAHTGLTAGTEVIGANYNFSATKTWATGAIATQREVLFQAPTYAFAGASTVANAATVAITGSPIAGANATLTASWSLWVQSGQILFGASTNPGITFNNGNIVTQGGSQPLTIAQSAVNAAIRYCIQVTPGNQTAITSGTESPQFVWVTHTNQWATTVPSTQREWIINAPTYSCDTAGQTIGTAATFDITGAPIAGTNVTITNNYALRVESGNSLFGGQVANSFGGALGIFPAYFANGSSTITGGVTDGQTAGIQLSPTYNAATALTVTRYNYIKLSNPVLGGAGPAAITDGCVFWFDANPGTHKAVDSGTTKTTPGTVNAWEKRNVNGTIYYAPLYTSKTT